MDIEMGRIQELEEELRKTPYNKATQHHIGRIKARISRLKEEAKKRIKKKTISTGFALRNSGDATLVIVGFPSVGKSTLLNKLTGSDSPVADYDFTTLNVIPGIMEYHGARIQVLDVPGLIKGASGGKGRGKEVLSVIRNSDIIAIIIDVFNIHQLETLNNELYEAGVRLNQHPPKIKIEKRDGGGLNVTTSVQLSQINIETIKIVLIESRIHNANVVISEDVSIDQIIDAISGNRVYIPSILVLNKIDLVRNHYLSEVKKQLPNCIGISAVKGYNLDKLQSDIYLKLKFIRIFTKKPGKKPDLEKPIIMVNGSTVGDVCDRMHADFKKKIIYAKIWGRSVKHSGQMVGLDHKLKDKDVLAISIKR
tara:strand:+ start:3133 stop:4230 length:1098 start_codon:yes stop_codon:yes gene_type:complete